MNITGRLTRDAEVKALPNDRKVVNFSIAVNDHYRNKQGEDIQQTAFFDCAYWQGTNVAKILTKGALVELTGRVSARAWLSKDGEPKAGLNFHTSKIKLHARGQRQNTETNNGEGTPQPIEETEDDLPF
ncbi:single-stranded DNA-binding protein [Ornithobacterium rhinotracheale]|uniref:Single-stranded DNA-binding protein n=1 Tax=Ornithobacterium rhinotracheale (strain ATCC 51463 / DSM 15997 / CCUG 23171 / CIP 104009 / LMG 9086) TaxID=867902 RepID=I4A2G1_ORNRL|nr:single-stranded DNA-binding protein [Ornithobacterium rhinotracheale]AFL98145.1 single stranded DNA-binding protein [Ornithobacterium rhinotracheale DSM 15997]AIP99901.1 single-stranded DNA-binding protein [Ornithobacterium rhinotracheale ORT-UMN 88]KGB66077.1 single-stranded DNA-binding protein [Ornithobacterium rhinotracheale H06-030791]MBN3661577.1 single-stranded DNA-binding protein [Ornithobacterium rhinotracheale]MCK0193554.1 single-stranded DNA-binding protein [Ornithobacterium rhino